MGRPVVLVSGALEHAFVGVGYDGADFIVHDPAGLPGYIYRRMSAADLGLRFDPILHAASTVVVPLPLGNDRPLVTVNIKDASLEFVKPQTATAPDIYQFRWDYTRRDGGYSFRSLRTTQTVATIPGEVTALRPSGGGEGIEIANAYRSGGSRAVSVWIDITGKGPANTHYSDQITVNVAPGETQKVNFKPINVDDFRDPAPTPTEYTFRVRALVGGREVDDASFTFVMEPSKTPTPTPTATPKATPQASPTATAQAGAGEWVLQEIIPQPAQAADSPCYFNNQVSLGDGAFSSSGSWKDEGCRAEGGPYYSGAISATCS